jgi:5-methylcytosine-specific restriction endonuclease McrA
MDEPLRAFVRRRAAECCEYCGLPQSALPFTTFHLDHIIAEQHGGTAAPENLALCCSRCNLSKGPNLSGIDPETGAVVTLFNPRTELWADHFEARGDLIVGLTPTGRATVGVLGMNEDRRVRLRGMLRSTESS